MNPVVHFEMPYEDAARVQKFYSDVFGWKAQNLGEDMGGYITVATGKTDEQTGRPTEPGFINGGLFKKSDRNPIPGVVIAVDDIKAAMQKVKDAGGKILGSSQGMDEPDDIPGVGLYMSIEDPEGNRVALLQPKM